MIFCINPYNKQTLSLEWNIMKNISAPAAALLFFLFINPVLCDEAVELYREAVEYLTKGKVYFKRAMEETSGGVDRTDLCSKARKEFFEATLKAEKYNKLTGKGDGLLEEIQRNDYNAFKMAPSGAWSPPVRYEEPEQQAAQQPPPSSGAFAFVVIAVIVLGLAGGIIYLVINTSKRKRPSTAVHHAQGHPSSSRRKQAVSSRQPATRPSSSSRRQKQTSRSSKQRSRKKTARQSPRKRTPRR